MRSVSHTIPLSMKPAPIGMFLTDRKLMLTDWFVPYAKASLGDRSMRIRFRLMTQELTEFAKTKNKCNLCVYSSTRFAKL